MENSAISGFDVKLIVTSNESVPSGTYLGISSDLDDDIELEI
jgi:hypothetical protein